MSGAHQAACRMQAIRLKKRYESRDLRLEKSLQTYIKDRLEVRGTRYEGDAEDFYKGYM